MEDENTSLNRRALLLGGAACALFLCLGQSAHAKDGDGGSGGGGSGGGGGDGSGGGDGGGDDGGGDDGGDDNGGDDDGGDDDSGKSKDQLDTDKIRDAVQSGKAIPLAKAVSLVKKRQLGRIIDVKLISKNQMLNYRFKVITKSGAVKIFTLDAKTGRF